MTQPLFHIRDASEQDQEALQELVRRVAEQLCQRMGSDDEQQAWVEHQCSSFKQRLVDPQSNVLVAETPWGLVGAGYIQLGGERAAEHECDAYLGGLFSAIRGMGVGVSLNRQALMCAAARGAESVYARLPKANKQALRDLQDLGFRRLGEQPSSILPGSVWVGLEMQLLHAALDPQAPERRHHG